MRIQPSTVALGTFLLAVLTGWAAQAQNYPAPMSQELDFQGVSAPPGYAPQANPWGYPAGADGYMNAYPNISPYLPPNVAQERVYNDKGVWYNDQSYQRREYIFSLEYLRAALRRPGTDMIGDPDAFESVGLFDEDLPNFFMTRNVGVIKDDIPGSGLRGRFAMINADDTSLDMSVWFVPESSDSYNTEYGDGDLSDPLTVRPRGSIPLDDGADGLLQLDDTNYRVGYTGEGFGANIDWISTPIIGHKGFGIRTMAGLKFLHIRERFTMLSEDSGLEVEFDDAGVPITLTDIGVPAYSSNLNSQTSSYLAGPEAGIRYEFGGGLIKFWGQTTVAIAANSERIALSGTEFGDPFTVPFSDPQLTFRTTRHRSHVSPIVDTQIHAELDIFKHLPGFKKSPLFKDAKLRVGYTFIMAGEIVRPTKVIVWTAPFPDIETSRSRWTMGAYTFGIDWKF